MRFLVDAQLPPALCRRIEARGYQAEHVADAGLLAATDREIVAHAEETGAVLVSKDEDFLLLRLPDRFAFLWLRCGNATNRALQAWLHRKWRQVEEHLVNGERLVEVR